MVNPNKPAEAQGYHAGCRYQTARVDLGWRGSRRISSQPGQVLTRLVGRAHRRPGWEPPTLNWLRAGAGPLRHPWEKPTTNPAAW